MLANGASACRRLAFATVLSEPPHVLILDEPTNYLDRDSLGALSAAIKGFEGGVLMISHNAEFFGDIAPEVWEIPGDQAVHVSGAEAINDFPSLPAILLFAEMASRQLVNL